eukprot:UN32849
MGKINDTEVSMKKKMTERQTLLDKMKNDRKSLVEEVTKKFDEWKASIENRKQELLKEVDVKCKVNETEIQNDLNDILNYLDRLSKCKINCKKLINDTTLDNLNGREKTFLTR